MKLEQNAMLNGLTLNASEFRLRKTLKTGSPCLPGQLLPPGLTSHTYSVNAMNSFRLCET